MGRRARQQLTFALVRVAGTSLTKACPPVPDLPGVTAIGMCDYCFGANSKTDSPKARVPRRAPPARLRVCLAAPAESHAHFPHRHLCRLHAFLPLVWWLVPLPSWWLGPDTPDVADGCGPGGRPKRLDTLR